MKKEEKFVGCVVQGHWGYGMSAYHIKSLSEIFKNNPNASLDELCEKGVVCFKNPMEKVI